MLTQLLSEFRDEFKEYQSHDIINSFVLICGMIHCRTVCLYKLRSFVGRYLGNSTSSLGAHYKRLTRFFCSHREADLWQVFLAQGLSLFRHKVKYLILDGTKWKIGARKYHFQTLSMVYKGLSIPIAWIDLEKMGSSSEAERIALFTQALDWYQLKGKTLLADREYVGTQWFNFLIDKEIDFIIRIRLGDYEKQVNQSAGFSYDQLLAKVSNSNRSYAKTIQLGKGYFSFSVKRNRHQQPFDPYVILLSSTHPPKEAYKIYALRWQIEQCFKHLKSNGFCLEKMGLKDPMKVRLMMAMVIFAYCISVHFGLSHSHKTPLKTYANGKQYPQISVFRLGLDTLDALWNQIDEFIQVIYKCFKFSNRAYLSTFSIHVQ